MPKTPRELEAIVARAHDAGAKGAQALTSSRTKVSMTRADRRSSPMPEVTETLSVRCWLADGRSGVGTSHPDSPDAAIKAALEAAAKAPAAAHAGPVERLGMPPRGLGIDDPRHAQVGRDERFEIVEDNEVAAGRAHPRVRAGAFRYHDIREHRAVANSRGVAMEAWSTRYEASGIVSARTDDGLLELSTTVAGRSFTATACLPFGAKLAQRAAALLEPGPPVEGPVRVLLTPLPCARLMGWLAERLFDPTLAPFLAAASGPVFHRAIHLVDDGSLPGGLRTRGFDDEGVVPMPMTLLREGAIDARPLTVDEARANKARPTGHMWGDRLRPTNLQVHAGMRSVNANLGEQTGLVFSIDDLPDLDGSVDLATGDIDAVVHGHVYDRQTNLGARRNVRLRGNLKDALSQVAAVASDTDRILHVDAPAIFVDGFTVDG